MIFWDILTPEDKTLQVGNPHLAIFSWGWSNLPGIFHADAEPIPVLGDLVFPDPKVDEYDFWIHILHNSFI